MKQNMKNQTISELYTNDKNLSQLKASTKNFIQKKQRPKLPLLNLYKANVFLENVTKSINSHTNIESPGNNSLTANFYKHLSNELHFFI